MPGQWPRFHLKIAQLFQDQRKFDRRKTRYTYWPHQTQAFHWLPHHEHSGATRHNYRSMCLDYVVIRRTCHPHYITIQYNTQLFKHVICLNLFKNNLSRFYRLWKNRYNASYQCSRATCHSATYLFLSCGKWSMVAQVQHTRHSKAPAPSQSPRRPWVGSIPQNLGRSHKTRQS